MASREEVFHKKVLGKLYPVPQRSEKSQSPKRDAEAAIEKTGLGIKAGKRPITDTQNACQPHRRLYTVLPPPPDFVSNDKGSGPLPATGVLNTDVHLADEDEEVFQCGGQRRRRRRVRKAGRDGAESPAVQAAGGQEDEVTPTMAEGETKLSRNKRRKLKKKRRKEKFLSLGLTPSAAALQFIYQPEEGSREAEGEELIEDTQSNEKQMAELLEFLQTTLEVYGRSTPDGKQQDLSPKSGAQALLNGLFSRAVPPSDLCRLRRLRSLVLLRDVDRLSTELGQFQQSTTMGPGELSLICSLFRYWITDILPASGKQTAQTS
ncbi:uncharacterized protein erich1 [Paramormyrops kingsleyae]|uniref:uncharacterized protein erich1 n=1 Tax=Paramormyrops kingsleyae TaxID=1676925 RepID=UPI003B97C528